MENQLTNNANALRLFFTEDIFLVGDKSIEMQSAVGLEAVVEDSTISNIAIPGSLSSVKNIPVVEDKPLKSLKPYPTEVEIPRIVAEPATPKTFKFLGGNKKSVLILVNDKENDVSTEQGRELLRKIVKAVDLGTPDFAVLNYANYIGTDFVELQQFFKPQLMLVFGVQTADLKLDLSWQHEIIVHESTRMIFAPNLHHLDTDVTAKKLLWGNLQKVK